MGERRHMLREEPVTPLTNHREKRNRGVHEQKAEHAKGTDG